MSRPHRVLVATFGSAGDLFPLVPIVRRLRDGGHDVRCAVSRPLGLYVRAWGMPMYALGSGAEMRVFEDGRTVTARFGGWGSWRHLLLDYVLPTLRQDVELLGRIVGQWRPDVVVCGSFSPAGRVVAHTHGIPRLDVSIYPQHPRRLVEARGFGRALREAVARLAGIDDARNEVVAALAWGADRSGVVLHDRAVLGPLNGLGEVVGFPYWDQGPQEPSDAQRLDEWLGMDGGSTVAVCFGSFLGVRQRQAWLEAAKVVEALGLRAVFVGPRRRGDDAVLQPRKGSLTVGFVPLSRVADRVDAVVHHGGMGTMFAVLGAGCPAVVVPQAFDQPFNAGLVEHAGVGVDARRRSLHTALEAVMTEPGYASAARRLSGELVPGERATGRAVERILGLAG